jgi:hypothetical protein
LRREREPTLSGGDAHGKQMASGLLADPQVSMMLQCSHKSGQKRDQAFDADGPGGFPRFHQRLLDLLPIVGQALAHDRVLASWYLIEQSNGILASVASHCYHGIQQQRLLGWRSLLIVWSHALNHLAPAGIAQG